MTWQGAGELGVDTFVGGRIIENEHFHSGLPRGYQISSQKAILTQIQISDEN